MKHITPDILSASAIALALAGCGGDLVAPEGPATNSFLNQVAAQCGHQMIGKQTIAYLLDVNSNDVYFVDETSKLAAGEIDKSTYADDINSFYPTGSNQAGLDCVFRQLK